MKRNIHGGEHGGENITRDFSININPLGIPENVMRKLYSDRECFEVYPDTGCSDLTRALSYETGISPNRIVCGNGASDLIYRICQCFNIKKAIIPVPAFSEYERAVRQNGGIAEYIYTSKESGYIPVANDFSNYEKKHYGCKSGMEDESGMKCDGRTAVFLCNPSNPSGKVCSREVIKAAERFCSRTGAVLIIDECFIQFTHMHEEKPECLQGCESIVLRAFTKIYAMAGLRLGYAICSSAKSADMLRAWGSPWSVSGPAQKAGVEALHAEGYIEKTVKYVENQRRFLYENLEDMGLEYIPSDANYILFEAPYGLDRSMQEYGIAIRDCSDYEGLEAEHGRKYFRIAVRTEEENRYLCEIMRRCLKWL